MKLNINAQNIELTEPITDYLNKKVDHLKKFLPERKTEAMAYVELGKTTKHHQSGKLYRASMNVRIDGRHFMAVAEEIDLYAAIDAMKDEMERELTMTKDKHETLVRKGGRLIKGAIRGVIRLPRRLWPF